MLRLNWRRTVEHPTYLRCVIRKSIDSPDAKLISVTRLPLPKIAQLSHRYRIVADFRSAGRETRAVVDSIQLGRGRTGVNLIVTASYANRKTIEAAGVELARLLAGRITP